MAVMQNDTIKCPACGSLYEDETNGHVTYWGEEPHKLVCEHCEHEFTVKETVMRGYEIVGDG